jgi:hypothetical protein
MEIMLLMLATVSPVIAGALAIVVWRFYRAESRRVDAQIAALTELALVPGPSSVVPRPESRVAESRVPSPEPRVPSRAPVAPRVEPTPRPHAQAAVDLPLHAAASSPLASSTTLFREEEHASPWGARAVVMGALGLAAAAVVLFALAAHQPASPRVEAVPAAKAGAASVAAAGLELMSLRDARQNGTLTITGLVQNPRGGAALSHVVVTAFAFDAKGSFLASGRAPLDYTTLQPGEESPFVVTVPVPDTVARYRIGFRGDDGRVIAHVDRRQATTAVAENR